MMNTSYSELILADRENRYNRLMALSSSFKLTILSARINYPGQNKLTDQSLLAFVELKNTIFKHFESCVYHEVRSGLDGCSLILILDENSKTVKRTAIDIEESHKIGRLFDIDIINEYGEVVSRQDLNQIPRSCILCENEAQTCVVLKSHSLTEVIVKTNHLIESF